MAKKILVVDDDAMNLRMAEMILAKKGYEVHKADSGEACLSYLESEQADLVLLDVEMPGMSGFEVLDAIRSKDTLSAIPVLFLSASEELEAEVAQGKYAVSGFVKKPFLPPLLYAAIEDIL